MVKSSLLGKSEIAGSNPSLAFKFQRNKMFPHRSLVKIQYCGELPCPRGSVLGLRSPGLLFRILCLEGSVIPFITPSSGRSPGPFKPRCEQMWPTAPFISFYFYQLRSCPEVYIDRAITWRFAIAVKVTCGGGFNGRLVKICFQIKK